MSTSASQTLRGPFFFIHVMKTAGTTFAFQLRRQFPADVTYPWTEAEPGSPEGDEAYASIERLLTLPPERRAAVELFTGHFPYMVCEAMAVDLVTLTVLREPVARTVSVLRHFKRLDERYRSLPLEAIYEDEEVYRYFVHNHQAKIFALTREDNPRGFLRPITWDDDRLALAKENLAKVDVIGLTERYAEFVEGLRARFGWWTRGVDVGGRANASIDAGELEPAMRRRIAEDNAYDVEFYRYATELVDRRRRAAPA